MLKRVKNAYALGLLSATNLLYAAPTTTASSSYGASTSGSGGTLTKKVLSDNFVVDSQQNNGGFLAIFKNLQVQFSSLWGFVFTISAVLGVLTCLYGVLKFREAGRQDSDSQKDPLTRKGMWAMSIGVVLLCFSAFIAIFADTAGVGGVVATGVGEGQRIGVDNLDGKGISNY